MSDTSSGGLGGGQERSPQIELYSKRMLGMGSQRAPVVSLVGKRRFPALSDLPFASISVFVMLLSLLSLSLYLGGWTWSSWTYTFSLGVALPLVALELKRKVVITGGAILLLATTVIIGAGLPQYFGYSSSDLSWYDLAAHYLGALFMTVFLWSLVCWTVSPSGPSEVHRNRRLLAIVAAVLAIALVFEFAEFITDLMFGWRNFHPGIDTYGDIIFDIAGIVTAALLISRHGVTILRRPFWHEERSGA